MEEHTGMQHTPLSTLEDIPPPPSTQWFFRLCLPELFSAMVWWDFHSILQKEL